MAPVTQRAQGSLKGFGWNAAWGSILGVALLTGAGIWVEEELVPSGAHVTPDALHHHEDEADRNKGQELLERALAEFAKVDEYRMEMRKKERVNGKLGIEQLIVLSVRQKPFKVHMAWKEPKALTGQEAVFCHNSNPKKMKGKSAGFLGNIGFVSMNLDDPMARATSRHGIDEAGFENLFRRLKISWDRWEEEFETKVHVTETEIDGKTCTTVDVLQDPESRDVNDFARTIISFAADSGFPVRMELYGWSESGEGAGELLESYQYGKLELNPGLPEEFHKK